MDLSLFWAASHPPPSFCWQQSMKDIVEEGQDQNTQQSAQPDSSRYTEAYKRRKELMEKAVSAVLEFLHIRLVLSSFHSTLLCRNAPGNEPLALSLSFSLTHTHSGSLLCIHVVFIGQKGVRHVDCRTATQSDRRKGMAAPPVRGRPHVGTPVVGTDPGGHYYSCR